MLLFGISLIFLLLSLGMFSWLAVERFRYYKTGDDKKVTLQYTAAIIAVFALFAAIAFFGWARLYAV